MILTWPHDLTNKCWIPFIDATFIVSATPIQELSGQHYNFDSDHVQIHALLAAQSN